MPIRHHPVVFSLTRQPLPTLDRTKYASAAGVAKGGYVLADADNGQPTVLLIGTGSEVRLCVDAYEKLTAEGVRARVVCLPSWELFEMQDPRLTGTRCYRRMTARVTVELGSVIGWDRYAGRPGR